MHITQISNEYRYVISYECIKVYKMTPEHKGTQIHEIVGPLYYQCIISFKRVESLIISFQTFCFLMTWNYVKKKYFKNRY